MLSAAVPLNSSESTSEPAHLLTVANDAERIANYRQALTALVLSEKSYFLRTANSILRNPADAEDAVHSAFCSAWKAMTSFRGDSSLKTWFTRVVANSALSLLRSKRTGKTVFLEDNPDFMHSFEMSQSFTVEDPEQIAVRKEKLNLVHRHIESLPTETRNVLMLHFANDCSIESIAQMRGKSRPSIAAHLHRGKAILRKKVRLMPIVNPRSRALLQ